MARSSWRTDTNITEPTDLYTLGLTLTEYQMILHLRMLESGRHQVMVHKNGRSREGLLSYLVTEDIDTDQKP